MEGATRSRGHRPYSAARPPGARSANDPSTCQRGVCGVGPDGGKSDPSRARDTRVDDPDDRGGLQDWHDVGGERRGSIASGRPCDTPTSNTRGRDRRRRRSRRGGCTADTFSGEAACPRRRSGDTLRLDTHVTPVAQREATGSIRRSIEAVTEGLEVEAPDPHLVCHGRQRTRTHTDAQAEEAVDADGAMDAQTRPQLLAKPRRRGFARAPTAIIVFVIRRPERNDPARDVQISTLLRGQRHNRGGTET